MSCEWVRLPDGTVAIVRFQGRRRRTCEMPGCHRIATKQCDFPIADGERCDKYLCADCAVPQDRNRDHCRDHEAPPDLFSAAGLALERRGRP